MSQVSLDSQQEDYIVSRLRTVRNHVKTNTGMLRRHYDALCYPDEYDENDLALAKLTIEETERIIKSYKHEIEKWQNHVSQK
jgi:hypothetical protein